MSFTSCVSTCFALVALTLTQWTDAQCIAESWSTGFDPPSYRFSPEACCRAGHCNGACARAHAEALIAWEEMRRKRFENAELKVKSFWGRRLEGVRGRNAYESAKEQQRSEKQQQRRKQSIEDFLGGEPTAAALRGLRQELADNQAMNVYSRIEVGRLGHGQFQATGPYRVLNAQGRLLRPSPALESHGREFARAWNGVVDKVTRGWEIHPDDIEALLSLQGEWRRAAEGDASKCGRRVSCDEDRYLRSVRALVERLAHTGETGKLREYVQNGGFLFPGGDTDDLIRFVLTHRVVPAPGSEAMRQINKVLSRSDLTKPSRTPDAYAATQG